MIFLIGFWQTLVTLAKPAIKENPVTYLQIALAEVFTFWYFPPLSSAELCTQMRIILINSFRQNALQRGQRIDVKTAVRAVVINKSVIASCQAANSCAVQNPKRGKTGWLKTSNYNDWSTTQ
jgi:hypothetical protein